MDNKIITDLMMNISGVLSPVYYLKSLGWKPFEWQEKATAKHKRLVLNCNRQAGKSTVVSAKASHKAKYYPNSLILLIAPSERQSAELMLKVEKFLSYDTSIPAFTLNNKLEKEFANKSRILALPGSEKTTRGFSDPDMVIIDEASRCGDDLFYALLPMMEKTDSELILMSTPHGKRGFFYDAWNSPNWKKIEVIGQDILGRYKNEKQYRKQKEEQGVWASYSPRHTKDSLQMKLEIMGEWWYRQEYCGEFVESEDNVFNNDDIMAAITTDTTAIMGVEDMFDEKVEALKL